MGKGRVEDSPSRSKPHQAKRLRREADRSVFKPGFKDTPFNVHELAEFSLEIALGGEVFIAGISIGPGNDDRFGSREFVHLMTSGETFGDVECLGVLFPVDVSEDEGGVETNGFGGPLDEALPHGDAMRKEIAR